MPRKFMLILMSLTLIVNCSNLDNQHDKTQLICGESKANAYAWLHIDNADAFDAILIKDGILKTANKTEKSCIAIKEEDRSHRLLIRDSATRRLSLGLDLQNLAPGLSNFSLARNSEIQNISTQVRCSASEIFASDKLELFFKRNDTDTVSHPMVEIKIFDPQKNLHLQKTLMLGNSIPPLPLGLADGQYSIEMRNFDAFQPESIDEATPESCSLVIDTSLPHTQLITDNFAPVEGNISAQKVPPGAKLEFSTDEDPGLEFYVCLKPREDENIQAEVCDIDDFRNVGNNLNAPESGAWDLYAFSKDKAGNTSSLNHSILYIYHDALIAEIRALSKTIQLLVEAREDFEAFKNFQKLLEAGKKLALEMELDEIYWHLFTHFDWVSNKNGTVWAQILDPRLSTESVAVSPFEDAWAVSTNGLKGGSYIYKDGTLSHIKTPYHEFKFVDRTRMVGIRQEVSDETILDLFENNKLVDSRSFKNYYEDIEIDTRQGVFVLLSLTDLVVIDISNVNEQRVIPLPESVKYLSHPGLEFSISPDAQYYYVSFAEYILRIHWNSGAVAIYQDPKGCWIRKPDIAPTGEIYYVNYNEPSVAKDCQDVYRIDWSGELPKFSVISEDGKDYDSIAIVDVNKTPVLVSARRKYLDIKDLTGTNSDQTLYTGSSGFLKRHPMYRDILYLETARSIHLLSLGQQKSEFLKSKEIPLPGNEANRSYFPTRDFSKFLLIHGSEVQIHSFEPEKLGIMENVNTGDQCTLAHNNKFSLCRKGDNEFQWADHETMLQKIIKPTHEFVEWQILTDGEVIFATANRELFSWKSESESLSKIGDIELEGKVKISWFPVAKVLAVHHAVEWGEFYLLYPEKYLGALPPKTRFYTKKSEGWFGSPSSIEGVPLPRFNLPVVLVLRATSKSAYIDVINQNTDIINTLKSCSFQNLDLQKDYIVGLAQLAGRIMASGIEPYLYSTCSRKVRKFNIYDGTEHTTFAVPDGYQAQLFEDDTWVWLENAEGSRHIMNFRTGLSGDFLDEDLWKLWTKEEWRNGTFYFSDTVLVNHRGDSFSIELRPFFQTSNPFIVGLSRKEGNQTTISTMKIDPHWMDAQLQKNPLYRLERKEISP